MLLSTERHSCFFTTKRKVQEQREAALQGETLEPVWHFSEHLAALIKVLMGWGGAGSVLAQCFFTSDFAFTELQN